MKNYFTFVLLFFIANSAFSQAWTINYCSNAPASNLGSSVYGPMYTSSAANATNRTAVIYPAAQLAGISGKELTSMFFYKKNALEMLGSSANFKIYLKETTATDFGTPAIDWATETAAATKVFDSNPQPIVDATAGWKGFNFSTLFTYSGTQNLAVFMEYTNPTASNSITWAYEFSVQCILTSNPNTTKYDNNTTGTPAASLASTNYRRPYIGFSWTGSCSGPVTIQNTTNIALNSATINWTAGNPAPSNGYSYYYQKNDSTPPTASTVPTGTVGAGITTANITGLDNSSKYYFWVRPECGNASGAWSSVGTFSTLCPPTALPWSENFDTSTVGVGNLPMCWVQQAAASGNAQYSVADAATNAYNDPKSAPNYAAIYYHFNADYYMWTPGFSMTAGRTYQLKFYWVGDGYAGWSGKVFVNSTQNPTGATLVKTFLDPATTTVKTYATDPETVNFTPTADGVYHFGISTNSTTNAPFWIGFDDFSVNDLGVLAVGDSNSNQEVQLFPNPTKDVLNVKGMIPYQVSVFTADGKNVPVKFEGSVINTKNLTTGSYIIQVKDKSGKTVTKRFIKK